MKKKVSIIIRTYNSEKFVKKAINSALNQSFPRDRCEILVLDDGSSDRTLDILEQYKNRINLIKNAHIGAIAAINMGIKNASAPHVILLDSDDLLAETCVTELYNKFEHDKKIAFAYCDYWEHSLGGAKEIVSVKENIFNSTASGIMFRKDVLFEIGLYDETLVFPEYDVLIKVIEKYQGVYVEEPLFHYIRRSDSVTADKNIIKRGINQLFKKYGVEYPIRKY